MKHILISSSVALVIGFAFGWIFKSSTLGLDAPSIPTEPQQAAAPNKHTSPTQRPTINSGKARPSLEIPAPHPEREPFFPKTNNTALDAKWQHFSSSLSLSEEQANTIANLIEENHPDLTGASTMQEALRIAGEKLESSILATLSPEQQEAFKALQERALYNQLNAKAMRFFSDELSSLDLTPNQRDQAIETLIQQYEQKASTIPNSSRLLLTGTFLPLSQQTMPDDGIFILEALGQNSKIENLAEYRREEIQRMVSRFDGILTPAQIKIYEESVRQSLQNLDIISPP